MTNSLPNEIWEKIFLQLSWNNLRKCKDVCRSWNYLITVIVKARKLEETIEQNCFKKDPRVEE